MSNVCSFSLLEDLPGARVDVPEVRDVFGVLVHDLAQVCDGGPAFGTGRSRLDHVEHVLLDLVLFEMHIDKRVS